MGLGRVRVRFTFKLIFSVWVRVRVKVRVSVGLRSGLGDRKSTRLNSSHSGESRMPSSA